MQNEIEVLTQAVAEFLGDNKADLRLYRHSPHRTATLPSCTFLKNGL